MLCWTPVTLDCNGGLEPAAVVYRHEVALLPPQGFIPCTLDGVETTCPLPPPVPQFGDAGTSPDPCIADVQPGLGEILFLRTTAIDAAGNEDCGR